MLLSAQEVGALLRKAMLNSSPHEDTRGEINLWANALTDGLHYMRQCNDRQPARNNFLENVIHSMTQE